MVLDFALLTVLFLLQKLSNMIRVFSQYINRSRHRKFLGDGFMVTVNLVSRNILR